MCVCVCVYTTVEAGREHEAVFARRHLWVWVWRFVNEPVHVCTGAGLVEGAMTWKEGNIQ